MYRIYKEAQSPLSSVQLLECGPVVEMGDNNMSDIIRVRVKAITAKGETREDSLIVKCLENAMPLMKDYGIFHNERQVYGFVLKAMEEYFKKGEQVEFGPK